MCDTNIVEVYLFLRKRVSCDLSHMYQMVVAYLCVKTGKLNAAALGCQGNDMLWRDGAIPSHPRLQVVKTIAIVKLTRHTKHLSEQILPGELRCIDLQPLARMGNQHLCSHPKTSPVKHKAALSG